MSQPRTMKQLFNRDKIILDLCGGTGAWSRPYAEAGYDVRVITWPDDVRLYEKPKKQIYGILIATPCTQFAASGARWWKDKGTKPLLEGLSINDACLRIVLISEPVFWCLENPVGRLRRWLGQPVMYFNPCDYGDPYTKKTALWGNFNIPGKNPVEPTRGSKMHLISPCENRQELRSITPPGFSRAFFEANK